MVLGLLWAQAVADSMVHDKSKLKLKGGGCRLVAFGAQHRSFGIFLSPTSC